MAKLLLKIFIPLLFFTVFLVPRGNINAAPIKILLVPGHDDALWGAQYGNIKEADMNLRLATELYNLLKKDKRFEVHITRNSLGYTKEFADYFAKEGDSIILFRENAKKARTNRIESGEFLEKESVEHNTANENTSVILYGINKWADEKNMDAVIHIHFNDYPRPNKWTMGKYKGFVIYMPEEQMLNAPGSIALAKNIFTELKKKYATSTYEKEEGGMVADQSLIALGSNGTLLPAVRSILIEYGYIYRFKNSAFRHQAYKDMASLTATGIKKYFFPK